jgi:ElaA protein
VPHSDVLVRDAHVSAVAPQTLYRILALRVDVFVLEQNCVYRELDGRDLEPSARQVWAEQDGVVVATLRLLRDPDGCARIGRVATAAPARGQGLAGRLVQRAMELSPGVDVVLGAQSHLAGWYAAFGFERDGVDYDEDGIAHTPMRRRARRETRET